MESLFEMYLSPDEKPIEETEEPEGDEEIEDEEFEDDEDDDAEDVDEVPPVGIPDGLL